VSTIAECDKQSTVINSLLITFVDSRHDEVLSKRDGQPSPVDHTKRPAWCIAWWAIGHHMALLSAETCISIQAAICRYFRWALWTSKHLSLCRFTPNRSVTCHSTVGRRTRQCWVVLWTNQSSWQVSTATMSYRRLLLVYLADFCCYISRKTFSAASVSRFFNFCVAA